MGFPIPYLMTRFTSYTISLFIDCLYLPRQSPSLSSLAATVKENLTNLCALQVSVDAAAILKERDELAARLQSLETQNNAATQLSTSAGARSDSAVGEESPSSTRSIALLRKLAEKQGEIHRLKVCWLFCLLLHALVNFR